MTQAVAQVRAAHEQLPPDAWLEGHGWDVDRLAGWPTAASLATAAGGRRIAIWAHDHHALWGSEAALDAAGVRDETPDPPGGLIRRDATGSATGVLHETATRLVTGIIPPPAADAAERGIVALGRRLVALGVVAIHDPGALSLQAGLGAVGPAPPRPP